MGTFQVIAGEISKWGGGAGGRSIAEQSGKVIPSTNEVLGFVPPIPEKRIALGGSSENPVYYSWSEQ